MDQTTEHATGQTAEQEPQITPFTDVNESSPSVTVTTVPSEPAPSASQLIRGVTLSVARKEQTLIGHLIVAFAKPGALTCQELLRFDSTLALLHAAETQGVAIDEAALLAMVDKATDDQGKATNPPRQIARTLYLTPMPGSNFRDFAVWVGMVTAAVRDLKMRQVGFYLCKDTLNLNDQTELTGQVVRALIESHLVDDISFVVGQQAYNDVLSMALALKQELDGGETSLHVLH